MKDMGEQVEEEKEEEGKEKKAEEEAEEIVEEEAEGRILFRNKRGESESSTDVGCAVTALKKNMPSYGQFKLDTFRPKTWIL